MQRLYIILSTFCILLLAIRYYFFFTTMPKLYSGEHLRFETLLLSDPTASHNFQTFSTNYVTRTSSAPIFISLPEEVKISFGDRIRIDGIVRMVPIKGTNRVIAAMRSPKITTIGKKNVLFSAAYFLRDHTASFYRSCLSPSSASLLLGIVLGVKENVSKDFMQQLQSVGVVHVIAASGMNVTLLAGFLISLLSSFINRKMVLLISIMTISFYALLAGLQPSIVRAAIMTILVFSAQLLGRQYAALHSLFLTSVLMLMWSPDLLTSVGFQLSVMSTLGILIIKPLLPFEKFIGDDIGTTLAAQIATVPILLGTFNQYGVLSILVNALVLWTVPPLMILGGVGALLGLVSPLLGSLFLFICAPILFFFETVVHIFGSLQLSISIQTVPLITIIGSYFVLISIIIFIKQKAQK